jgi:hypothetical protein
MVQKNSNVPPVTIDIKNKMDCDLIMRLFDTPTNSVGNIPHNDKCCSSGYKTP